MAKKYTPKWKSAYDKELRNLKQNVRRMKQKGYDVSNIKIPERPERYTEASVRNLQKLNQQRYKKATYEKVSYDKKTGEKKVEKVSGEKGKYLRKVQGARKASVTRATNRIEQGKLPKHIREIRKAVLSGKFDEIVEKDSFNPEDYVMNPETGELTPKREPIYWDLPDYPDIPDADSDDYEPYPFVPISHITDDQTVFDNAMHELDIMIDYEGSKGGKKHDAGTRSNAQKIKDFLEDEFEKNPTKIADILRRMEETGAFHSVEYIYRQGGYGKFLYDFAIMFKGYDWDYDEDTEDFNSGYYE